MSCEEPAQSDLTAKHPHEKYSGSLLHGVDEREAALERAALRDSLGQNPSDQEVLWGVYRRHMLRHAQSGDWCLYRDTRLSMAHLLEDQGRAWEALDVYLEVAYLDANGPRNNGTCFGHRSDIDCFDPARATILPGVVLAIRALAEELRLTRSQLRDRHLVVAETARRSLRAPLSVHEAWSCLSAGISI